LKQATYDLVNIGHFGLASQAYIQFTSPIRRYPDVVAHRRLKQRLARMGKPAGGFPPLPADAGVAELHTIAAESSFAERKAMEIEREVVDLYRAFFLRDRIGDVLSGTISAVTSFGVFVATDEPFVEGLIRSEELGDDIFSFDETGLRLVGRRSGFAFALGDTVSVEVLSVSVARRRIDFRLQGRRDANAFARPGRFDREGRERRGRDRAARKREKLALKRPRQGGEGLDEKTREEVTDKIGERFPFKGRERAAVPELAPRPRRGNKTGTRRAVKAGGPRRTTRGPKRRGPR
jgi:ribonuclease R